MFPTFISILDIQSWWEVPSIAHFCSLFRTAFNLLDFDIEDLEEALLTNGTEEPSWLQDLIVLLLKGCLQEQVITTFNYQMFLRRLFREKCKEYDISNPFNTDTDFELLPLRAKIEILYNLCEFRLDASDVLQELDNFEAQSLRVEPIGYDRKKSAYWYFYGTRLYREDHIKLTKPIWQVVCFTITDWCQLAKKFEHSNHKAEQLLYKTLKKNFIPELPRLFADKETLARKRLLETKRFPKEDIYVDWNDCERSVLHNVKHKDSASKLTEELTVFDEYTESRYEMAKARDKKHKPKDGTTDRITNSSAKPKDVKPVGRQTNNSLASATGQILIQQVSSSNKKKMKTSQVFSQTEEDLQTGLHKILDHVKDHEDAWPFIEPVEEEYAPNYYSIIRKPMDLQKMEERLESGHYKSFSKFKTDFQLIVNNCRLYNGVENEYSEMVDNVLEAFNRAVERYLDQVSSSDDEIAVEFQEVDKHKKRKHSENNHKSKKKTLDSPKSDNSTKIDKTIKKIKKNSDEKEHKTTKKDKESSGKRMKNDDEKMVHKKGNKRKLESGNDIKSKRDEKESKIRKMDIKDSKQKHKKDAIKTEKDKRKNNESNDHESKIKKKDHSAHSSRKHKEQKMESKKSNQLFDKKIKKVTKKTNSRCSRSNSRSRSRSYDRCSTLSSSTQEDRSELSPNKSKKSMITKEDHKSKKAKHDKSDIFKDSTIDKRDKEESVITPKDKHNTLRETIEKLKAKSDLAKLKVEKDLKVYDFPNEPPVETKKEKDVKKKIGVNKKKKMLNNIVDEDNSTADSAKTESKLRTSKSANNANNAKKFDALSLATEQTLKDINKWLDDTPKFPEFSSASNSPSHFSGIDDFDNSTNKSSDLEKDKIKPEKSATVNRDSKDSTPNSTNSASNASSANSKKRPLNRDPTKIFRRKEVQRTIDRLQPGKSKGNLLTNVQSKDSKQEEPFSLGPLSKIKDTKNSLIVKTDDSAPKLSLGSVLDSFGKHKFVDDEVAKDETDTKTQKENDSPEEEKKNVESKPGETIVDSPKLDNSPGTATPNLSAWFKAFGGPKLQSVTKKADAPKDEKPLETVIEVKKDEKKIALPDPSPNPDSPSIHGQPAIRQRKVSTGSSMSERSSFSQDMDSPRIGIDERIGAYPAPYPSPLHKSPSGASPSLRSPLPDVSPKATYPFNGQIRVGFYQDTVSTKSSPEKSCSPRDNPQSPYTHYPEHVYTPPTTQNSNYSYNNQYYQQPNNYASNNPASPYNSDHTASYYDTSKPLTDQYNAKNAHSPAAIQQQNSPLMNQQHSPLMTQQHSPLMAQQPSPNIHHQVSPVDMQQYQQPNSPVISNQQQHQVIEGYRQSHSQSPVPPSHQQPQAHPPQQQQAIPPQQEKFIYNAPQLHQHQVLHQPPRPVENADFRQTMDYGRQSAPPNVEPFRNADIKPQNANSYPVKKRAYNEIEQTDNRIYEESFTRRDIQPTGITRLEEPTNRDNTKYIHQNIPEPRGILNPVHPTVSQQTLQTQQTNPAVSQYPPADYNYTSETNHQYPPINVPSANRNSINSNSTVNALDDSRKIDLSKYTNMGYTGTDVNLPLLRTPHYKQAAATEGSTETIHRFPDNATININNYKQQSAQNPGTTAHPVNNPGSNYKADATNPRPTYGGTSQMEMDPSLSIRGLSHIVDRYPNEDNRMLGLQSNAQSAPYYSDKNLPPQHIFSGKPIATSTSTLPMFSQPNTASHYGVQAHPNIYNHRQLQVPPQNPAPQVPQQQAAPTPSEPKPRKKRVTKAAKAAAAAAAAAQAAQATTVNPQQPSDQSLSTNQQGFQSYAGIKSSSTPGEPNAISLKTASVVPGSAFNFGPSTTGLSLAPGLYGDKESYSNFLEDFRSAPNYYMAAAAAAHHRATPENVDKAQPSRVTTHQTNNPPPVPSSANYPFIGGPQPRPPSYPLPGVPGPFMPPHQGPLMDTSSPQYLQYLQAGVLHQGLLPPSAYASGYHPALSIRQQFDTITRPPWL